MVTEKELSLSINDICCLLLTTKPDNIKLYAAYNPDSEQSKWFKIFVLFVDTFKEKFPDRKEEICRIFREILSD